MKLTPERIELAKSERERLAILAAENAAKLGIADYDWQRMRADMVPILADIIFAVAPEMPANPDHVPAHRRALGPFRFDALQQELIEGRESRDVARLRRLIDECTHRRSRLPFGIAA